MKPGRTILIITLSVLALSDAWAQRMSLSPYSRYGYGELENGSFGAARSMGGLGYGLRSSGQINALNPASYTAIDSLTFMMELGVSGKVQGLHTDAGQFNRVSGMLDYVAFQMPVTRWMALSFGLNPRSTVGYDYQVNQQLDTRERTDSVRAQQDYSGDGGVSQVYLGLSFDILDRVALGVNAHYLFGELEHTRRVSFPEEDLYLPTDQTTTLKVSSFTVDFGLQYHQPLRKGKDELMVGAAYALKLPMNFRGHTVTYTNDTVATAEVTGFEFPQTVGAGVAYRWADRLTVGLDYEWKDFSHALFYNTTDTLVTRSRVALGAEYVHDVLSKKYYERIRFRAGVSYANSYVRVNGFSYGQWTVTLGLGFPLPSTKTVLNVHFEYGHAGSLQQTLLVDQYFRFGLGVSLNELWFVKRKLN